MGLTGLAVTERARLAKGTLVTHWKRTKPHLFGLSSTPLNRSKIHKERTSKNILEGYHLEQINEKVRILKIPGRILRHIRRAQGLCIPQKSVLYISILFFVPELFLLTLNTFYPNQGFVMTMLVYLILLGPPLLLFLILHFFKIVIIRKECYECEFRFHIIAHELNHLKFNSLDEELVERETLKQTGSRLFPIILSNPSLCKDCFFRRKKYREVANEYDKKQARESKTI